MWSSWINEISVLEYKSLNIHKARHPIIDHTRNIFLYIHERLTNCSRMADKCIACNKIVSTRQQAIQCDGCLKWNHRTCNSGKCNLLQFFVNSLHCSLPHSFIISQAFLNKSIEKLSTPAREYSGCVSPVRCQLRRVLESHQSRQPPF